MVRMEGLEPAHLSAPDPKSGVSTNFTTSAILCNSYTACIRPRRGCKDKKEINNTKRQIKKRTELVWFFLKLGSDFFHKRRSVDKTLDFGVGGIDNRVAVTLPPFFSLVDKEDVVADFHDGVHVVGNDHSSDFVFLGDVSDEFVNDN